MHDFMENVGLPQWGSFDGFFAQCVNIEKSHGVLPSTGKIRKNKQRGEA